MTLIKERSEAIVTRIRCEPEFALSFLDEASTLFLNGDPETARLMLRDLVDATVGFEQLAQEMSKSSKSLSRMLSVNGNPSMDTLTAVFSVLREKLKVHIEVHTVPYR